MIIIIIIINLTEFILYMIKLAISYELSFKVIINYPIFITLDKNYLNIIFIALKSLSLNFIFFN